MTSMRDINKVVENCKRKLDAIGIEYGIIVSVTVNTRAQKRWGQCKKIGSYYMIDISSRLLSESVELIHLEDTIIHEILHTCRDCMDHGKEWKRLADKVNAAYGYNIKRTASMQEVGIEPIHAKYKFVCNGCGQVINRMRESKFTRNPNAYKCGICGGKFERVF